MKKSILTIIILFATIILAVAQVKVKGKVTDAKGREAMGVIVSVKDTDIGAVTDFNGNYTLEVPNKSAVLIFKTVGEDLIERQAKWETINVKLQNAVGLQKIALFDKYGSKVFEKEVTNLQKKELEFSDFMDQKEFNNLKYGKYLYLLAKDKTQHIGYLNKYTEEELFFRGKKSQYGRTTPYTIKIKENNLCKNKKIYLEIDDKKTQIVKDTTLYGAKIIVRRSKIVIDGGIPYKEKASLYIGDREITLDDREREVMGFFQMHILSENEKGETLYLQAVSDDKKNSNIVLENKNGTTLLFVVDGVVEDRLKSLGEVSPDSIANISILKRKAATAIYGTRGKNGAVIITTKKK